MTAEQTMIKLGFQKDEDNAKLNETFKDNIRLKEIHIDCYPTNPLISSSVPYMLLLRIIEKKMLVKNNGSRIVFKKCVDGCDTYFMNVLLFEIKECYYKNYQNYSEFIINVQNIWYRINIFN